MTRRMVDRNFDPKKQLLVRRAFSAAGRTFQAGDDFNWKRLAINMRRVKQMFDAGHLMHTDEDLVSDDDKETESVDNAQADVQNQTDQQGDGGDPLTATPDNSDLDVDSLVVLQAIATREGAALKSTKAAQRQSIIENRANKVS